MGILTLKFRRWFRPAGCFRKRKLFSPNTATVHVHVTAVFGHRKRRLSNTLSRVKIFENGDSSYSCGQAKTEVFKDDHVTPRFKARFYI